MRVSVANVGSVSSGVDLVIFQLDNSAEKTVCGDDWAEALKYFERATRRKLIAFCADKQKYYQLSRRFVVPVWRTLFDPRGARSRIVEIEIWHFPGLPAKDILLGTNGWAKLGLKVVQEGRLLNCVLKHRTGLF